MVEDFRILLDFSRRFQNPLGAIVRYFGKFFKETFRLFMNILKGSVISKRDIF